MPFLTSRKKLRAAATSMHQFLPVVRGIFPEQVAEEVIEAVALFIYDWQAERVFGRRFTGQLRRLLRERYRSGNARELEERVACIRRHAEYFAMAARKGKKQRAGAASAAHAVSTIQAIMLLADLPFSDRDLLQRSYQPFEDAVRRVREHLQGIDRQNVFIMK